MSPNTAETVTKAQLSIENCDKEPVHIPGHIQGFATLIATDTKLQNITHCSANAQDTFGRSPDDILGQPLLELFDSQFLHDLNNVLSLSSAKFQRERVGTYSSESGTFEVWAHLSGDIPILEFEKLSALKGQGGQGPDQSHAILTVRSLLTRLQRTDDLQKTLDDAVIGLRGFSGFDRVMVYQFDANGDGEVKAEARSPHMTPFLGLRFPKWDIPNQVRDIMKKLPLRMIADARSRPVTLMARDPDAAPLDMTLAACRGPSPIHCEYLANMGVISSMSLSIIVNDALWGLFAFHNETPDYIDPNMRGAAEVFAQFFSLQMDQRVERTRNAARSIALTHQAALMDAADEAQTISDIVKDIVGPFCRLLDADGLAMVTEEGVVCHGLTPGPKAVKAIVERLFSGTQESMASHDCLAEYKLDHGDCAGALALRLKEGSGSSVVFFRKEASISVTWAGAPDKLIVEDDDGPRLKPRGSFAAYTQSIEGKSEPWEAQTLVSANEIRLSIAKADTALFKRLSQKEERQRSIYIAELNHRVRNILALIRSISRRSHQASHSLESYVRVMEHRITALAAAHDLATNQVTGGVSINTIIETEAKPFVSDTRQQLFIAGEPHMMQADAAPIFALVAHELMTNCVKYGALSSAQGSLHVTTERGDGRVKITWAERGGPAVQAPDMKGFGLGLIEKAIPYELEGESKVEFGPEGLTAILWLPEKIVNPLPDAFAAPSDAARPHTAKPKDIPASVLIVENSMMVALDTSDMLQTMGVETIETCATAALALSAIEAAPPDFAVLDVSLRETNSFPVAEALQAAGIPFCFMTGFGSDMVTPKPFISETVLTKPTNFDTLRATIIALYHQK